MSQRQKMIAEARLTGLLLLAITGLLFLRKSVDALAGAQMSTDADQKITPLTIEDEKRLNNQRAVVEKYLGDEPSRQKYKTAAGKLGLIRAILDANIFKPSQTYELQCLGIVLGDAFVEELKMEWVMVEEKGARDPAVRMPRTSIILFPLTMISKRMARGDKVEVFDLFNGIAEKVDEMQKKGC